MTTDDEDSRSGTSTPPMNTTTTTAAATRSTNSRSSNRLLFASCNSQFHEQVLWPAILSRDPTAFAWGGDTIYADDVAKVAKPERIRRLYEGQKLDPGYKELLQRQIPILGVIDDHNYGTNNGDRTYPHRTESGIAFACEFLEQEGTAFCDRARKGLGVYDVKVFDFARPKGQEMLTDEEAGLDADVVAEPATQQKELSDRSVAVYLLDIRTNRTPNKNSGIHVDSYEGDFLGEKQWQWFEEALRRSTARVNIVVQGIQVHVDKPVPARLAENWHNFPTSQHRLYQAMLQKQVNAPILVSGDVHHAQLLRKDCQYFDKNGKADAAAAPKMLLEVTTSGMTHAWGGEQLCWGQHQSSLCQVSYIKWVTKATMQIGQLLNGWNVWTELIDLSTDDMTPYRTKEGGKPGKQFTLEQNFGEFEFDWENQSAIIRILGKGIDGEPLLSSKWSFDSLSGGDFQSSVDHHWLDESHATLKDNNAFSDAAEGQWICVNYRGKPNPVAEAAFFVLPIATGLTLGLFPFCLPLILMFLLYRRLSKTKPKQA